MDFERLYYSPKLFLTNMKMFNAVSDMCMYIVYVRNFIGSK